MVDVALGKVRKNRLDRLIDGLLILCGWGLPSADGAEVSQCFGYEFGSRLHLPAALR
jgi:hypothetical protein